MADWKAQISYNYNPSYHAYAYGLMYQPAPEQNQGNLTCWGEAGVTDLNNYNTGVTQAYYATTARTRDESPPGSPEQHAVNGHHHYQGSGVVYLGDAQAGRLFRARPHRAAYDARAHGVRRAGSDSTSDSEPHTSPEPWSSSSSRGGSLPQIDSATWTKKDLGNEAGSRSSTASKDVSSSLVEEPQTFAVTRNKSTNNITSLHVPLISTNKLSNTVGNNPKGKVRAAFSESQMNALVQRFSVQRYLTPAEMKNLAEMTGLTYKQVKTWFQNRRMKLRRHQKDTSWVSERYTINKDSPLNGTIYTNIPSHIPSYQGEAQPQLKEHYNQHMVEAALKKTAPQNVAFYLAAMGSAAGPPGYHSWSSTSSQTAVSTRPQATGWSMPPGVGQYEYSPNVFNSSASNTGHDMSFETKDEEPVDS
ncbi:homeobox protein Hox-B5a-like [Seriola lalandi dorsalis]|uniref:homeobox protein Hox-B5a-like n=1 Tax=Seriola lalandi dorsalis TaxID=1841481 RepID=UPI000C6FCBC3|nr:homeobox protein Hox-B5a-like [Seriola lalandi dorsalis]XP_056220018.1 homeobox protein NANOG [Seriola aureovittata]